MIPEIPFPGMKYLHINILSPAAGSAIDDDRRMRGSMYRRNEASEVLSSQRKYSPDCGI
uniref:Uncharacterized protein n=1 Tax=Candidatus Kentrum sp. FW TaxID=2126338 RepID=A0A450T717_9GAMM|nr:MAG: hypothetical protein BECKFW1821B_GA0114236_102015 [Candidatus Kentron sp. FW]VFJ62539.1 MAG: hypothetical protein BECKFW1821A_GA0114235_11299 [Candidatus Kentron sp. FW]